MAKKPPLKERIDAMSLDEQKQLLADTLAGSALPLIEQVLRQRARQWVDEIYAALHKETTNA